MMTNSKGLPSSFFDQAAVGSDTYRLERNKSTWALPWALMTALGGFLDLRQMSAPQGIAEVLHFNPDYASLQSILSQTVAPISSPIVI
jgi:hypothetical protein